ncbi:MAG: DNRLRE domain-containing protein [bacterium]|nr:DNRLRE domain-containing protein [bacterium]
MQALRSLTLSLPLPLALISLAAPTLAQYPAMSIAVSEDTWVNADAPNTNYFTSTTQGHRGIPTVFDAKESYLRIDFPANMDPGCAYLVLDRFNFNTNNVMELATVDPATNLASLTWNTRPAAATVFDTRDVGTATGLESFDISPVAVPGSSVVIRMRLLDWGWGNYHSLESTGGSTPEVQMDLAAFAPSEDNWVMKNDPTASHPTNTSLAMRGAPGVWDAKEAFLRFSIPAGIRVQSARLVMYSYNLNANNTVEIAEVTVPGSVDALTWNTRPTAGMVLDSQPVAVAPGFYSYDVTSAVAAGATLDLRVRFSGNGWGWYRSKEHADGGGPLLVIDHDACRPVGTPYCSPNVPNSSGQPASIAATGSDFAGGHDLHLHASQLPQNQFGYFLASETQGFTPGPGTAVGNLCLGGVIARFSRAGEVGFSGPGGAFSVAIDTNSVPVTPPWAILPGETWNFQGWYRDLGNVSNFTDAVEISFR